MAQAKVTNNRTYKLEMVLDEQELIFLRGMVQNRVNKNEGVVEEHLRRVIFDAATKALDNG